MGKLTVNGVAVPCRSVLFDLDGTILDDMVRYRTMARARFEEIRNGRVSMTIMGGELCFLG